MLCVMEVDELDDAITTINANPYGNGASIFTSSGHHARRSSSPRFAEIGPPRAHVAAAWPVFESPRSRVIATDRFQHEVDPGQLGINVAIPVALPYFSFSGNKRSFWGDLHMYGKMGVQFYTRAQTVTAVWPEGETSQKMTSMPILK